MARPCKPIALATGKISREERELREKRERDLRGNNDRLEAPMNLTEGAKTYFNEIVSNLEESKLLGNGDIGIITITAMTRDKVDQLETLIQTTLDIDEISKLMKLQDSLQKSLKGYYNDLGLTPTSRSRLASLQVEKREEQEDPLLVALAKLKNR